MSHTTVSAVQFAGRRDTWDASHVYVGMPGRASRAFGIPDDEGLFGKPWACLNGPEDWPTMYLRYLVGRLANDATFASAVADLHGKVLLCWCAAKDAPRCHAVILAEMVELLFHHREEEALAAAERRAEDDSHHEDSWYAYEEAIDRLNEQAWEERR